MKGIRHFLRDFTASAVREHLRSQIEATGGSPDLTKNEIDLVRFMCGEGSFDWRACLTTWAAQPRGFDGCNWLPGRLASEGADLYELPS